MRTKRTALRLLAIGAVLTLALAACGGDDDDSSNASATTKASTATTKASSEPATVAVRRTSLGPTLVDAKGKTVYLFDKDTMPDTSTCSDACATTWPPVTTTSALVVGKGLDKEDFKTFARADGTMQVSVYGHPLYTYAPDMKPGDTNGQGVGGVWFAVGRDGQKIQASADAGAQTTTTTGY
jgi:predicted lipoprotein with Yx(FWY)xxD motif